MRAQADPLRIEAGDGVERHDCSQQSLSASRLRGMPALPQIRVLHTLSMGWRCRPNRARQIACLECMPVGSTSVTESVDVGCSQHSLSAIRLRGTPALPHFLSPHAHWVSEVLLQPLIGCKAFCCVPVRNMALASKVSCA